MGQGPLQLASRANAWADGFAFTSDDRLYNFAVLLDTAMPAPSGWLSARPLAAHILLSANFLHAQGVAWSRRPPFWGISPDEMMVPPEFFATVERLAYAAGEIRFDFMWAFAEMFLKHLPREGLAAELKAFHSFLYSTDVTVVDWDESIVRQMMSSVEKRSRLFEERLRLLGYPEVGRWDGLSGRADAFEAAGLLEFAVSEERTLDDEGKRLVVTLAEQMAATSPLDSCLFLTRLSSHVDEDSALRWQTDALRLLDRVPDPYVRAEFLSRFRQLPVMASEAIADLHAGACVKVSDQSVILGHHATGHLGGFLCHPDFPWNAQDVLGVDPSWAVLATFSALSETLEGTELQSDLSEEWRKLHHNPELETVDGMVAAAGDRGLECSIEAVRTLAHLANQPAPRTEGLNLERLISLLNHPSSRAYGQVEQSWLTAAPKKTTLQNSLRRVAAVLNAERHRALTPDLVHTLFDAIRSEDDGIALRATLALTGILRDSKRQERRFSVTLRGVEALQSLCEWRIRCREKVGHHHLARTAGLAINDWVFDDAPALAAWCENAVFGSDSEKQLLEVVEWVDIWSEGCQRILTSWVNVPDPSALSRRHEEFVLWAARQAKTGVLLNNTTVIKQVHDSLAGLPTASPIRQFRCFPAADSERPEFQMVLTACRWAADQATDPDGIQNAAEAKLRGLLHPLYPQGGGTPDPNVLEALGGIQFSWSGDFPEKCLPLVLPVFNDVVFLDALLDWLEHCLQEWTTESEHRNELLLRTKLEALLSLASCLSMANLSTFARASDLEKHPNLLGRLAFACLCPPSDLCHMAAITVIGRLKSVNLDAKVAASSKYPESADFSVFDALLYGLTGEPKVQQRTALVLPLIQRLEGAEATQKLEKLLLRAPGAPLARGTTVLAAAQLLFNYLRGGKLSSTAHRQATGLLRKAADAPENRRPLYRFAGTGNNEEDPVTSIYAGDLREELAALVSRIS